MRFATYLAAAVLFAVAAHSQTNSTLMEELSAANQRGVQAWRSQDRAAFAATFAPRALYVSNDGIFAVADILDGLMTCTVGDVTISNARVERVSDTVAIMVSKQHQQVLCSGHQEPTDIHSTQTFVKGDGAWRVALRTDTPTHR